MTDTVVFFRSKLSHPLSPKTPLLQIDMIINIFDDGDDNIDIEKSVYISLYDLTYRHNLKSNWIDRLKILLINFHSRDGDNAERSVTRNSLVTTNVRFIL